MELYFEDIVIPQLIMTPSRVVAYKGASVPVLTPNSGYYHGFVIFPSLPSPLLLDSYDGSIKNIPSTIQSATEYTITATDIQGHTSSTTITLSVIACSFPNTILTLQVEFTNYQYYAIYGVWMIKTPSNTILDSRRHSSDNALDTFSYCVIAGTYTFSFGTPHYNYWKTGMYYIKNGSGTTLESGTVTRNESPKVVAVTIGKLLEEGNNYWKYLQDGTQPVSTWITSDFSDASWGTALSSLIPVPSSQTQYYRTTFVLDSIDLSNIAGFEFAASTYAGLILYMNGQEIMRFNMPSGDITKDTLATKGTESYIYYKSSFPISSNYVIVGTNVVAVEVHSFNIILDKNEFDAYIQFISKDSYRIIDGIPSSDIETTGSEGYANVFDSNKNTYTYSGPRCVGGYYTWTYNNGRKEFINKLSVTNSNSGCYNRNPSGWILEGSNDNGVTWDILFGTHDQLFTTPSQTIENAFYSNGSYNSYRYTATQCNNVDTNSCSVGLELSEISLYADTISVSCQADGVWGAAPEGGYSYQSCSSGYIGYKRRVCTNEVLGVEENLCVPKAPTSLEYPEVSYTMIRNIEIIPIVPIIDAAELVFTIDSTLPEGLILENTTGIISGTPVTTANSMQYTITATNGGGSASFQLTMNIIEVICAEDGDWPTTNAGSTASIPASIDCSSGSTGSYTRLCTDDINGVWAEPVSTCVLIPPTITYTQTTITAFKNITITSITPSITGLDLEPLTISPAIPTGLTFNTATGVISGTPTVGVESTVYTITATNAGGSVTTTVTISITVLYCSQEGDWPETEAGETASIDCNSGYSGTHTRLCNLVNPVTWAEPVNACVLIPPTITLSSASYSGNKNFILNSITPTITGLNLEPLTISPAMIHGLSFNTATGVISGTPNEAFTSSYTITITNSSGSNTVTFSLTVSTVFCSAANGFPETEAGETAHLPCDQYYHGSKDCQCMMSIGGIWADILDNCILDVPTLSYATNTYSFFKDDAIERIVATTTGLSFTVSSNPTLPAGLSLDSSSGSIQGTPTVSSASTYYTITIMNTSGSNQVTITLEVKLVECPAADGYPVTERGTTSYIACVGASGVRSRSCLSTGYGTANWGTADVTGCVVIGNNDQPGSGNVFVRIPLYLHGLSNTDANKNSVKSILRSLIVNHLDDINIPASNIIIESVVDASTTGFFENIAKYNFRINSPETSAESVKTSMNSYVTESSGLLSDLKSSESEELRNVNSVEYKTNEVIVQQNGLTTQNITIIIIVVIIIIIIIVIVIVVVLIVHKNKKSSPSKPKLASHDASIAAVKPQTTSQKPVTVAVV